MKTIFKSEEPKKLSYRDCSNVSSECFKDDLMSNICQVKQLLRFREKFQKIKTFRGNQKPHININFVKLL